MTSLLAFSLTSLQECFLWIPFWGPKASYVCVNIHAQNHTKKPAYPTQDCSFCYRAQQKLMCIYLWGWSLWCLVLYSPRPENDSNNSRKGNSNPPGWEYLTRDTEIFHQTLQCAPKPKVNVGWYPSGWVRKLRMISCLIPQQRLLQQSSSVTVGAMWDSAMTLWGIKWDKHNVQAKQHLLPTSLPVWHV